MKNPLRLLVVDDDARFRRITTIALDAAGIQYEEAEDGEQALAALERSPSGRFDAVLLDVDMPRTDGWGLLLQLRNEGNEVPVHGPSVIETVWGKGYRALRRDLATS